MRGSWVSILLIASLGLIGSCSAAAVEYDSSAVIINGERKIILSGSIHYPRSTVEMWSDLIHKAKEGGLDTIETYIFWNAHEPRRREYNFTGNLDFVKFFQKVQEAGLHGILRIGPYACAEWNYGGFPVWLHNIPDIKFRTNNEIFKNEMQTFTTKIVNMAKEAKLFASQGGPIILAQIENEYGNVMGPYGEAGKSYVQWCAQMAVAQNTGVPWIMCQQSDAPSTVPKWGHLKKLHATLKLGEKILTNSTVKTTNYSDGWVELTTFTSNINGERLCFLSNTKMNDVNVDLQQDGNYSVPAWSVSILQDCNQEIYNTAKVNVQTSLIVKKLQENDTPQKLSWEVVNNGTSLKNVTLRVKYSGQFLHAFVNGKEIGSQHDYSFTFEKPALLKPGRNIISLLSATVGLQNYGEFFDEGNEGIAGGPVELIDSGITTDLSSNEWSYKVGLIGEGRRFYNPHSGHAKWVSGNLPVGSAMTWYKTTFQAPSGTEPVVVDLQGMGKGHAWVNGNSLGRFWPTLTADPNGCDGKCDYRGQYKENKCLSNCGNPTQRWYHVPRSFLNNGLNTLILFEEIGGNPSNVSFQITATETICGNAYEGTTLELSCNGGRRTISDVQFASFGDPQGGTCGSFQRGSVEAGSSLSTVEKACLGKESCSINISKTTFGVGDSFGFDDNKLAVQVVCK
ncbi:hypothetical protein OIU84_010753 [Salix udensis]|uniref:Beta-galactosidase n=1 Tax=Salix udensis TaxID=889485 RepID=A0AAD6JLG9_9ROSI|nr:hypothetical protein OIU84_010753 [Salix udensis]